MTRLLHVSVDTQQKNKNRQNFCDFKREKRERGIWREKREREANRACCIVYMYV